MGFGLITHSCHYTMHGWFKSLRLLDLTKRQYTREDIGHFFEKHARQKQFIMFMLRRILFI